MLLKRDDFQLFFEKIHNQFLENVYTPEGWMLWNFPDARNGLGWMHKLIKEHILETLGWFKIEEMNPEP